MAVIQIKGTRRESTGKGGARRARAAGRIPGVLYGRGEPPVSVAVDGREFEVAVRHHQGGNAIVSLNLDTGEHTALVRDVQYDPVSRAIVHLDFQKISLSEQIEVEVPLHLTGLAIGVKDSGGILEHIVRTVTVRCLPTAIPPGLDVDVTNLALGQSLHVRDVPAGAYTILTDPETTIATVVAPAVEEVVEAAPVEGETPAEPEVVGAKGKKEEGAEGAEEAEGKEKAPAAKEEKKEKEEGGKGRDKERKK
ncbi:MAG TPA: 50S ribosomal protein L25 [Candidatus Eisenbacteria bacterium]|nr:50S ribosomal protein L25 [Candidatus Eisenbacteria bacterium]